MPNTANRQLVPMTDRTFRTGWRALLEWALAFGLLALTVIGAASIVTCERC